MARPCRQRTIRFPFGQDPGDLAVAPAFRPHPHQVFFTNDYDQDRMAAWCRTACRDAVSFMVKARVAFYPTGSSVIQEERYYAEFARRADATAFCLKWTG